MGMEVSQNKYLRNPKLGFENACIYGGRLSRFSHRFRNPTPGRERDRNVHNLRSGICSRVKDMRGVVRERLPDRRGCEGFDVEATDAATGPNARAPMRERRSHIWDREADEHYVEPAWCSERL